MELLRFQRRFLHPRYWLLWLGLGFWALLVQLPYPLLRLLARLLGWLLWWVTPARRHIAATNIKLCFPELSERQQLRLLRRNYDSTAMALFESGMSWFWPKWRLRRLYRIKGQENLPQDGDPGALMMALHFTTVDIGGAFIGQETAMTAMYRPHKNPVYDFVQRWGRERHSTGAVIARDDVRVMLRALKRGERVWYAPDQDYGIKRSVFAPLFGVSAATVTATAKFARAGNAQVIPFIQTRLPWCRGYELVIYPPLDNFPSGDEVADATRINQYVEARIREQPEQYLWTHRRFKTRPPGEAKLY
jgi:KDO2-lipid IV(A) lauroyltransferase